MRRYVISHDALRTVRAAEKDDISDGENGRQGRRILRLTSLPLLLLTVLALLSACSLPGAAGASATNPPTATPAATATATASDAPSAVFIAENPLDASPSSLVALDPADGSVLWRSQPFAAGVDVGSPVQSQGVVLASLSDGSVVALAARDGAELWRAKALYQKGVIASPDREIAVDGNTFFVNRRGDAQQQAMVSAYRVTDGSRLWQYDAGTCGPASLAAASDMVILSAVGCSPNSQLTALHEGDGTLLWQVPITSFGAGIAIVDGAIYLDSGGEMSALDAATGATKWRVRPAQMVAQGGTDVSSDGHIVIAEASSTLLALRPQDGSVIWSADVHGLIRGHVTVGDTVYVTRGSPGIVIALRLSDGGQVWQASLDLPQPWPPVAAGGVLYVSAADGATQSPATPKLYAIRAADGGVLWSHDGGASLPAVG